MDEKQEIKEQPGETDCSTFPNPLCVRFGEGRILLSVFSDADGYGVILQDTGKTHVVGEDANIPPEKGVKPKADEIYLHFTNVESAVALRQTLDEAIGEMLGCSKTPTTIVTGDNKVEQLIKYWRSMGYTEEHVFPGEYILLVHPTHLRRVRVYYNGAVWVQAENGEYVKSQA